MGARQRLTLLAATSGAVLILLGRTAHGAAEQLVQVPPQAWGLSDPSDAVGPAHAGPWGPYGTWSRPSWHSWRSPGRTVPRSAAAAAPARWRSESSRPGERQRSDASSPPHCSSPCPRRRRWPARRPVAGMTWDGAPPARHPPHRRRSPRRRRRRPISPRRALRQVPATQKAQASQRTRHRRAARRHSPPPTPTPRPPQGPLIPSHPARACGPSPLTSCPPAPPPHRSRRTGRPCIAPTPRPSAPTRR